MSKSKSCGVFFVLGFLFVTVALCISGDQYDNRTGNKQAQEALNAALFRFRAAGGLEALKLKWYPTYLNDSILHESLLDLPDPYCNVPDSLIDQVFPYPANPAGTLKNILTRGYWLMGEFYTNNSAGGDFTATPPTGYQVDVDAALVGLIGSYYGVPNLRVQYLLIDPSLGSGPVFELVLNGTIDSTNMNYALGVTITLPSGEVYFRRDLLLPTCSVQNSAVFVTVRASLGITDGSTLTSYLAANPQLIVGTEAGGDTATAVGLYPGTTVRDYYVYAPNNPDAQIEEDIHDGAIVAAFDFSSTDFVNSTGLVSFLSGASEPAGYFVRQDVYSPDYVPAVSPSPPSSGNWGKPKNRGTNINFNFNGMLSGAY